MKFILGQYLTGEGLVKLLIRTLEGHGLEMSKGRGLSIDEASAKNRDIQGLCHHHHATIPSDKPDSLLQSPIEPSVDRGLRCQTNQIRIPGAYQRV